MVSHWLVDNKLSLHLGKTESIIFASKHKLKSAKNLNITCNGQVINSTSSVKYLGATLEQTLSGESMASAVIKKANARLKFLYRKQAYLTDHSKRLLVSSLIQCHFDYACAYWYHGLTKFGKDKLQVTQNKLIRFLLNLEYRSHIDKQHFALLGWLPVSKRVDQISLCHVFKINQGQSPKYMSHYFVKQSSVHAHGTRSSKNDSYAPPIVKSFGLKSFSYIGCKLWGMLPPEIKQINCLNKFKTAVKRHLL